MLLLHLLGEKPGLVADLHVLDAVGFGMAVGGTQDRPVPELFRHGILVADAVGQQRSCVRCSFGGGLDRQPLAQVDDQDALPFHLRREA